MTPIQKLTFIQSGVMSAMSPAGVSTNTAPTSIINSSEKPRMSCFTPTPSCSPTISGSDAPSERIEITPDRKSCTAPAKIVPKTFIKDVPTDDPLHQCSINEIASHKYGERY